MDEQVGWRGLLRTLKQEAPFWAATLPQLPRLVHRLLAEDHPAALQKAMERIAEENARRNDLLGALLSVLAALAVLAAISLF